MSLQGQHVLVLGLGISGLAMARWCTRQGARVTVADTREVPPQWAALREICPDAQFKSGPFLAEWLDGSDIRAVMRSPGLSPQSTAAITTHARELGLWLGGELSLFTQALAQLREARAYAPQILAVTGTNGKTTVTSLTGQLVARAGLSVKVAGNIGPSLLDTLGEALDRADQATEPQALPQVWVLELSSFQLDACDDFEPSAAVVLNLSQDHLDWHGSMQAYGEAKAKIFGQQALMVLNRDDAAVMAMLPAPVRARLQRPQERAHVCFGAGMPTRPGDFGLETVHGMTWLVRAQQADETRKRRKDEEEDLFIQRLMPADALRIRGRHNATNALAALALATSTGAALAPMLYGLREYRGEPHRVESVAVIDGVEFFDDSKGTNVGATVAALQGLGADRRIVVILGGDGKGQDFSPLVPAVSRHARAVILMGRDGPAIELHLQATGVPLHSVASLEDAVDRAAECAQAGDAVLLSPACASFDMFRHYEHRAEVFRAAVARRAEAAGVAMEGGL